MDKNLNETQLNVVPPTPPATLPVQLPKGKKTLVLMIVIHLIAIAVIGFYVYQNIQLKRQISIPQPTSIASIIPTVTPTINEKIENNTVKNMTYGFEMTFPQGWNIEPSENYINPAYGAAYAFLGENIKEGYSLVIYYAPKDSSVLPGPSGFGAGEWIDRGYYTFLQKELKKSALVYEGKVLSLHYYMPKLERQIIELPESDLYWNFFVSYEQPLEVSKINGTEIVVEQILSTFKFTQ